MKDLQNLKIIMFNNSYTYLEKQTNKSNKITLKH